MLKIIRALILLLLPLPPIRERRTIRTTPQATHYRRFLAPSLPPSSAHSSSMPRSECRTDGLSAGCQRERERRGMKLARMMMMMMKTKISQNRMRRRLAPDRRYLASGQTKEKAPSLRRLDRCNTIRIRSLTVSLSPRRRGRGPRLNSNLGKRKKEGEGGMERESAAGRPGHRSSRNVGGCRRENLGEWCHTSRIGGPWNRWQGM